MSARLLASAAVVENHTWTCGLVEEGVDYVTQRPAFRAGAGIPDAASCRSLCIGFGECAAWTWHQAASSDEAGYCALLGCGNFTPANPCQCNADCAHHGNCCADFAHRCAAGASLPSRPAGWCTMKTLGQGERPVAVRTKGLVSGSLPCVMRQAAHNVSLFCFSLIMSSGYEKSLIRLQRSLNASIFGCDGSAVYSGRSLQIMPGLRTKAINSTLKCKKGGEFGTWLNVDVFVATWTAVFEAGDFLSYQWTAKVDADAMFLPDRLRSALAHHALLGAWAEARNGTYLNNCPLGMHGPLEVLSTRAVSAWVEGSRECQRHFQRKCSGNCFWGEDIYMDQCLWKVLGVRRADDWTLLDEEHCRPKQKGFLLPPDRTAQSWRACDSPHAAFHPFKSVASYLKCWVTAAGAGPGGAGAPGAPGGGGQALAPTADAAGGAWRALGGASRGVGGAAGKAHEVWAHVGGVGLGVGSPGVAGLALCLGAAALVVVSVTVLVRRTRSCLHGPSGSREATVGCLASNCKYSQLEEADPGSVD